MSEEVEEVDASSGKQSEAYLNKGPDVSSCYYVYIVQCADDTLYTGITTDVVRRMMEHQLGTAAGAKYTRSHGVVDLLGLWLVPDRSQASSLECRIKALSRQQKIDLVIHPDHIRPISQEVPNKALINVQVVPDQVRDALWQEVLLREEAEL
ncbi:predicted endonuclease containing a URI domain protein [Cryptobacterium curtum DSM 15641]|uniref:Predicted endonuclease containing a URI domain protein n=1 Tax=Cryptobacterium curtum (strain ATCC 700683 / DSM 15641 / CCUG 43107 / 12-3) TaxID=469378 RepID=C7MLC3_CRYCD|nr:GIY-YIG nuclease family protein [Cryptobacterium curtum]ACU95070.1 predicted endonuclease containing a URI domain protein [Cryptobacterium curtum DSM 15641]